MGYILLGIILFVLYQLIVVFVWPIYKTTKAVRRQFQSMQKEQQNRYQANNNTSTDFSKKQERPKDKGEYIDFEEIKD